MTNPPDASGPLPPPLVTVTFTVTLIFFFILGMLFICFCRCCSQHLRDGQTANPASGATRNGLDPMVIHAFPTFVYSNVKHLRREAYELECAICLLEFEGDSILRLLTPCYHVFHQECIDLWLESHKSCPVCRGNLDLSPDKIQEKFPAALRENSLPDIQEHGETFFEDAVSINLEDDEEERGRSRSSEKRTASSAGPKPIDKLPRWNSTGHSFVKDKPDCKYTLRLPDNVKVRVSKGHTGSCITFGGFTARSHVAFDELPGCSEGKGSIE